MGFLDSLFKSFGNLFGGGGAAGGQQAVGGAPAQPGGGGLMGMFQQHPIASGLGMMGASQLFGGQTKLPSFQTPQMQQFQNFNSQNFQTMNPAMQKSVQDSLNIQNEQQSRNLRDVYKNARPGTDYTTDSAYQRDLGNLNRSQEMNAADAMANAQMGFNGQQLQANQQQLGQLQGGAENSINEIVARAGLQSQQQKQLKDMLSGLGGTFVNKGLFPNGNIMDMFKNKGAV